MNQTLDEPASQPASEPASANQSVSKSVNQSLDEPASQRTSQVVSQSPTKSVNQSLDDSQLCWLQTAVDIANDYKKFRGVFRNIYEYLRSVSTGMAWVGPREDGNAAQQPEPPDEQVCAPVSARAGISLNYSCVRHCSCS